MRSPSDNDLRVLVVADDHLARAGLAALLDGQPGCTVVGQVAPESYASLGAEVFSADVAVWGLGWDVGGAAEHLAEAMDAGPPAIALVPDESAVAEAWEAGVRGLLPRDASGTTLMSAVRAVAQGLAALDPELSATLSAPLTPQEAPPQAPAELTRRELEVLGLIAEGLPNKTIARRLDISEHTVKFHVNSILGKLGVQSRTEAVTRATRTGLLLL